jgi:hypothetical protein
MNLPVKWELIGWQIVNSYMKNNEVSLQQLLQTNAQSEKSNINLKVMSDKIDQN